MNRMKTVKASRVKELDFSKHQNRKFLVESFRELERIVSKKYQFWYLHFYVSPTSQFQGDKSIIDEIINKSEIIEPYMVGDFVQQVGDFPYYQRTSESIMAKCARVANRQCYEPKIKIDGELVFQFQNSNVNRLKKDENVVQCIKNTAFILSIEVEPNCSIIFTKDGKNPLLANPKDQVMSKVVEQKVKPPCTICAVAISNEYKLPSKVLTVIIKTNAQGNENGQINRVSGMVRPDQNYELLQSRSNYSQMHWL